MEGILFIIFIIIINVIISKNKQNKQSTNTTTTNTTTDGTSEQKADPNSQIKFANANDNSPVVQGNIRYMMTDNMLLAGIIKDEIEKRGLNFKKTTTVKLARINNIFSLIFAIATFVFASMYFLGYELKTCLIGEGVSILIYLIIAGQFNIMKLLTKKIKQNPDEDMSMIISNELTTEKTEFLTTWPKLFLILIIAIGIPVIYFAKPRVIYTPYGNAYQVFRYSQGIGTQEQEKNIEIADTYRGKDVVTIGPRAFKDANIEKVKLPSNLQSIKANAFYNCKNLKNIELPETVTEIRASAFENCENLETINLPEGLTKIRAYAFKNCKRLHDVTLPESLDYLGAGAFSTCTSLKEITIPKNVTEINGLTFEYCTYLQKVNLHDDIVSIHGEVFHGDTWLTSITLPSKITEIRGNTFEDCDHLYAIVIPDGVTRIGGHAFKNCYKLKYAYVPKSVKELGSSAFRNCYKLSSITISKDATVDERTFKGDTINIKYYEDGDEKITSSEQAQKYIEDNIDYISSDKNAIEYYSSNLNNLNTTTNTSSSENTTYSYNNSYYSNMVNSILENVFKK